MSVKQIEGGHPLNGELVIQGSKNAVLPVMAAAVLHNGITVIENVPRIQDVFCMLGILEHMGCICRLEGNCLTLDTRTLSSCELPSHWAGCMRSSIMLAGPLLGRLGQVKAGFPGGCAIGQRPIDLHLKAFRALGAEVEEDKEGVLASAKRLSGASVSFSCPSVGATENAVMAAVAAEGTTVIEGAAREPEIVELCSFLTKMGAEITGAGTSKIMVRGRRRLHDARFFVCGDRIAAGTYLFSVMACGGRAVIQGVAPDHLTEPLAVMEQMGAEIRREQRLIGISFSGRPKSVSVSTDFYPGFPTDLQSPLMAVAARADGISRIEENIFEERFKTAGELRKMGADIIIEGKRAVVCGCVQLTGGNVKAEDLRGGAALVVAGLGAKGITSVSGCGHIDRGYENICEDLSRLGGVIRRIE